MNDIFEQAKNEADKWINALNLSGKADINKIQEVLNKRTFEGKPVTAVVVRSPQEAFDVLKDLYNKSNKKNRVIIKQANLCIWDYYIMAFYESACSVLPNKEFEGAEFIYQSLFPAFEAGLGYLIGLGEFVVGVCLPQAFIDEENRIHCANGPAITWGDQKSYWWHGIEVPAKWIENKDNVDPALCLNHPNIEQRRALCEILGWEKVISQLNPVVIDKDDPEVGELMEVDLPDAGKNRFLKVRCGTGRTFVIPVPPTVNTALEANAWTYGIEGNVKEFLPEVRT